MTILSLRDEAAETETLLESDICSLPLAPKAFCQKKTSWFLGGVFLVAQHGWGKDGKMDWFVGEKF